MSDKRKYFEGFTFIVECDHLDKEGAATKDNPIVIEDDLDRLKDLLVELHCLPDVDPRSIRLTPVVPNAMAMEQINRISKIYTDSIGNTDGTVDNLYLLLAMKTMIENMIYQTVSTRRRAGLPVPTTHFHKINEDDRMKLNEVLYEDVDGQDVMTQLLMEV